MNKPETIDLGAIYEEFFGDKPKIHIPEHQLEWEMKIVRKEVCV